MKDIKELIQTCLIGNDTSCYNNEVQTPALDSSQDSATDLSTSSHSLNCVYYKAPCIGVKSESDKEGDNNDSSSNSEEQKQVQNIDSEHPNTIEKQASFTPEISAERLLYLMNIENKKESRSTGKDAYQYGVLTRDDPSNAALVLQEVLFPLLQVFSSLNSNNMDTFDMGYAYKFTSSVISTGKQLQQATRFELPSTITTDILEVDLDVIADDYTTIQKLEKTVTEWSEFLSTHIEEELKKEPVGKSPLAEIEFWRQRNSLLSGLCEQIDRPIVQKTIDALRMAGTPIIKNVEEKFNHLFRLAAESEDNVKFLSTLERSFRVLSKGSLHSILSTIPGVFDSMRIIWTVSRHYNRDERLAPLMERVANQLADRVKESISIKVIFRQKLHISSATIQEARKILESWRQTYMDVRAKIEEGRSGQKRWEFDRIRLFERTDYMAGICANLEEALIIIDQFKRFLGPQITSVTGESSTLDAVSQQVQSLPVIFETVSFDIFERTHSEEWLKKMNIFYAKVKETEDASCASIEKIFQTLRSASGAFHLVENFKEVHSRPSIHEQIEKRYSDVLEQYESELFQVEKLFQTRRYDPPIAATFQPVSGAIEWAESLYQRVKKPILLFKSREGLLNSGNGSTVKHRYLRFARALDSYKNTLFSNWEENIDSTIAKGLNQPILTRIHTPKKTNIMKHHLRLQALEKRALGLEKPQGKIASKYNINESDLRCKSNFSIQILHLIGEAKKLAYMGYRIPDAAVVMTLQEETFHGYIMDIDFMVKTCSDIISSLTPIEQAILVKPLKTLEKTLKPGFHTLKWTSQRIPAFVATAEHSIEKFKSIVSEVRKHSETIESIVSFMGKSSLIFEEDFEVSPDNTISISDTADLFDDTRKKRLDLIVQKYLSIKPVLLKVEMVITETETGNSPVLKPYYEYWEKRIHSSLVLMILRTLIAFSNVLIKCASTSTPIYSIEIIMRGKEFTLSPSLNELTKHLNSCVRKITESLRKFTWWKCLESSESISEGQQNNNAHTKKSYSFYSDVLENNFIKRILVQISTTLEKSFGGLRNCISDWKKCEESLNLWNLNRRGHIETLLLENHDNCSFWKSKVDHYDALMKMFSEQTNEGSENTLSNKSINYGIFSVSFTYIYIKFSRQAKIWRDDFVEVLHLSSKEILDSCMSKMEKFKKDLNSNVNDLVELEFVLNTMRNISDSSKDIETSCQDLKSRYTVISKYPGLGFALVDEVNAALSLEDQWKDLLNESKLKAEELAETKNKFEKELRSKEDSENAEEQKQSESIVN